MAREPRRAARRVTLGCSRRGPLRYCLPSCVIIASRPTRLNPWPLAVLRQMLKVLAWLAVVVLGLWALHRVALWAERRGWIYWTHRKASPGTAATALLELQSLLEPGNKHVVESRLEDHSEENESGEPPGEPANGPRDG